MMLKKLFNPTIGEMQNSLFDFKCFQVVFRSFTLVWLIYQSGLWFSLSQRPEVLYEPTTYLSEWFMPEFPSIWSYSVIILTALLLTIKLIIGKPSILYQSIVFLMIALINLLQWSYGYLSHVGHIFVLIHFLFIFIPQFPKQATGETLKTSYQIIVWFYLGVFITYTFSGLWKLLSLVYKIILKPADMNWLHADAALVNALSSWQAWDADMSEWLWLYQPTWLWQFFILIMLFLQIFSCLGAFRLKWKWFLGGILILFHLHNIILLKILFYLTPLCLLIMIFPYHLVLKRMKQA